MNKSNIFQFKEYFKKQLNNNSKVIDLTNPIYLYITKKQANLYIDTINSKQFQSQLHYPIKYLINKNIEKIIELTTENIDVIDLGPGLPDKTSTIVDYIKSYKENFRYIPVDINRTFLKLSANYFKYKNIPIIPLNCFFSELPEILKNDSRFINDFSRFFILGLTFNNFKIEEITNLFYKLLDSRAIGLIATEFLDYTSLDKVVKPYLTQKAKLFNFQMLEELGLIITDFEYHVEFKHDRIEMGFISKKEVFYEDNLHINANMKILTSISYRYTMKYLETELTKKFEIVDIFKNGKSKVSLITIKKKNHD